MARQARPLRVGIDATPLLGPRSGVGEVVSGIVPELAHMLMLDREWEVPARELLRWLGTL